MNKLLLSAAIAALVSTSAFAQGRGGLDVGIEDFAAAAMGGVAANNGGQAADESFNTLLSNNVNKIASDNSASWESTNTFTSTRTTTNTLTSDNGSLTVGDDIDDSIINTGSGIAADGDVTILDTNAAASASNAQSANVSRGGSSAQTQEALAAPSSLAMSANKGGEVEYYDIAGNSGQIAVKGGTNTNIPVDLNIQLRDVNTAINSNQQVGSNQALDDSTNTAIDASENLTALDSIVASKGGRIDQSTDNSIEASRGGQIGDSVDVSRGGQIGDNSASFESNWASKNDVDVNTDVNVEDNVLQNASRGGENEIED
jgi:hypothetical protein